MNKKDLKAARKASREKALKDGTYFLYRSQTIPSKKRKMSKEACRRYRGDEKKVNLVLISPV